MGYTDCPYIYASKDGTLTGYIFDYLKLLQRYDNFIYTFKKIDTTEKITALEKGFVDIVCCNDINSVHDNNLATSIFPLMDSIGIFYTLKTNDLFIEDFENYKNLKVGYLKGTTILDSFTHYELLNNFSIKPYSYDNIKDLHAALEKNEIDACISGMAQLDDSFKIIGKFKTPLQFIAGKKEGLIIQRIEEATRSLMYDSPNATKNLYNDYFRKQLVLDFSKKEQSLINQNNTITIGIRAGRAPLSYLKNNKIQGILPQIINELAENSGLHFVYKIFEQTTPIEDIKKDPEIDFTIANSLFQSPEAINKSSNSILKDSFLFVIKKNKKINTQDTVKIALIDDLENTSQLFHLIWPNATFNYYSSIDTVLENVNNEGNDIGVISEVRANYLMQSPFLKKLIAVGLQKQQYDFILLPTKQKGFAYLSILNKTIEKLNLNGTLEILSLNTKAHRYTLSAPEFVYSYYWVILIILIIIGLLIILSIFMQRKNIKLEEATKKANAATIAKSEFLANMSHELRTPLNGVIGITNLLTDSLDDKETSLDYVHKIGESSKILLSVINDILDMSAIESGKLKLEMEPFDIQENITSITSIYKPLCHEKHIIYKFNSNLIHEVFIGDSYRITQILLNLLSNAYKFTESNGHITVDLLETPIEATKTLLKIKISDTGCGMSLDMQKRLFQKFEQENASTVRTHGGSGLGLSICKQLILMMNGEILVDSEVNKGTIITINLPLVIGKKELIASKKQTIPISIKGMKILIADDNKINQVIIQNLLKKHDAQLSIAQNGREALTEIQNSIKKNCHFDAILMDIQMPKMDGYETTERIRAIDSEYTKKVPIFAMTANSFQSDINRALKIGMDGHISKPIDIDIVLHYLNAVYKNT